MSSGLQSFLTFVFFQKILETFFLEKSFLSIVNLFEHCFFFFLFSFFLCFCFFSACHFFSVVFSFFFFLSFFLFSRFFFKFCFFFFSFKKNMLLFLTLSMVNSGSTRDAFTQKIAATGVQTLLKGQIIP